MLEIMKETDPDITLETRIQSINELDFLCPLPLNTPCD